MNDAPSPRHHTTGSLGAGGGFLPTALQLRTHSLSQCVGAMILKRRWAAMWDRSACLQISHAVAVLPMCLLHDPEGCFTTPKAAVIILAIALLTCQLVALACILYSRSAACCMKTRRLYQLLQLYVLHNTRMRHKATPSPRVQVCASSTRSSHAAGCGLCSCQHPHQIGLVPIQNNPAVTRKLCNPTIVKR